MATVAEQISAGVVMFDDVMKIDAQKQSQPTTEIEAALDGVTSAFCKAAGVGLSVRIRFRDVHAMMGIRWHTELAFVELNGRSCMLNFHTHLLQTEDRNSALIFVAKSWVLLLVVDRAISLGMNCDGGFVFEIGDNGGLESVSFCSNNPRACLILDYDFALSNGYESVRKRYQGSRLGWDQRSDRLFWRGATTGRRLSPPPPEDAADDLTWLQRLQLCAMARNPAIEAFCDVGISDIVQIPEAYLKDRIGEARFLKPRVPREYFGRFKFVCDIDGNSNAWSGLFCSLLGGSCVFKIASIERYREWYYDAMSPWREYLPVASDFSDLAEVLAWARAHDAHAREIADRGRELAEGMTMQKAIDGSAAHLSAWLQERPKSNPG